MAIDFLFRAVRARFGFLVVISMRIGILANSLPTATSIYAEAKDIDGAEVLVLLFPAEDSNRDLLSHVGRFAVRSGRVNSLKLISKGAVVRFSRPLQDPGTISRLKELRLDLGLHKSGNIYRREAIDCFRLGILNAHIGLLPKYRGRSVMEWSLVQGDPVGISVFFIDEGIDTGERIVLSERIDISHCRTIEEAKQFLFEQDARLYRKAIERLTGAKTDYQINDNPGQRYYVMSKLFLGVAQEILTASNQQSRIDNRQ